MDPIRLRNIELLREFLKDFPDFGVGVLFFLSKIT